MNNSKRSGLVALALGPTLALLLSACVIVPAHRPYRMYGPEANMTVDYGDYYYYPHAEVYYSISTGYYFYRSGGAWLRTRVLPRRYFLNPRYRVRIQAPRQRPYERFPEHQRLYRNLSPSDGRDNRDWDRGERPGNGRNELNRGDRQPGIYVGPGSPNENPNILRRSPPGEPVRDGRPEYRRRQELNQNQREQRRLERQRNERGRTNDQRKQSREKKKSQGRDQGDDNQDTQQIRVR